MLSGTDGKDGVYQVKDTMNKRFVNRIDILESPGTKPYKFKMAKIKKKSKRGYTIYYKLKKVLDIDKNILNFEELK